jgi:RNAse (barnase) inhibitor barstar
VATGEKAKRAPGQWQVDFKGLKSRESMLKAVAAAFEFPPHFGVNLDALYDCLTDLPLERGKASSLELAGLPHGAVGDAVHTVFADAAEYWREHGVSLAIRRD